jgi:hypothetical protein
VHDNAAQRPTGQLPVDEKGQPRYEEIAGWPVTKLSELGIALAEQIEPEREEHHRSELDVIERVLAFTPGTEWARATVEVALADAASISLIPLWRTAAYLAVGQPGEVLVSLLGNAAADEVSAELWACLLQELVTRGADLNGVAPAVAVRDQLRTLNHPLATLPLRLLPGEANLPVPAPSINGSGVIATPYLLTSLEEKTVVTATHAVVATRVTTEGQRRKMTSAVQGWVEQSNGRVEAEIFEFAEPLRADSFDAAVLCALPLECLRGMKSGGLVFRSVSIDEVFTNLFAAAAEGGAYAYSSQRGGAHGREALWESVAALVGVDPGSAVEEVAVIAGRLRWWRFQAVAPWFEQDSVEFGFAVLREDDGTLAVLAVTDTD